MSAESRVPQATPPGGEALLRAMLDAADIVAGVFEVLQDDYRYVTANRNAAAFYGLPEGGLDGKTGRELGLSERQVATRLTTLRDCLATGETRSSEYRFRVGEREGWFFGTFSPIPGERAQVSFVVIDVTARRKAQADAERQRTRLELALDATGLGLWEYDLARDVVTWDARMRDLFGVEPEVAIDLAAYAMLVHAADVSAVLAAYEAALTGANGGDYVVQHRTAKPRPDGSPRWVRSAVRVVFGPDGAAREVIGTTRDISDEVAARQRQELLQAELNHRVKNNLAAVQAIASQTLRAMGDDPPSFKRAFDNRLFSMARGHDLLSRNAWETAALAEVLQVALAPFDAAAIVVRGAPHPVRVKPDLAVNLVMVLNELATNAAKYGALRDPGGQVTVEWGMEDAGFYVHWREAGGPLVRAPDRTGFGSRLTKSALRTFGGRAVLEFSAGGVECRLWAPVSSELVAG